MKIGEVMLKMGIINETQLEATIKEQTHNRKKSKYQEPIGNILLRKGIIQEDQLDKALVSYFKYLIDDKEQPSYVREIAKVAMRSLERKSTGDRLSEESKLTILKKIQENEEKIAYLDKTIKNLANLEQRKVIVETIEKENKEIKMMMKKIDVLKKDLETFS